MNKQLLLFILMLLPMVASADDSGSCGNNVTYTYIEATHTLTISGSGNMKDYLSDAPWDSYKTNIQTIIIESGVTSIGNLAFSGCSGLSSLTIPNSVTAIGISAFANCSGLTSLTIPNSVTSIGGAAFNGCRGLTSVTIPNSVTSIDNYTFEKCSSLTSVTIPNSVTSIGEWAFRSCSGLTSVTIGNSVTSIGIQAFSYCSGLTSVAIPNSVTTIDDGAFYSCSGLTSVTIPNSVTSICGSAFHRCSGLTSIIVENGNPKYDSRNNCNAIIETATNSLLTGCKNTVIPNSVTSIGGAAFIGCSGLTSVTIPNSVTSIGESAFAYCSGLTSMTIPNSISSIGNNAFNGCSGLISVTVYAKTPISINSNCFSNRANATLYVPAGCKAAYEAADYWNEFMEIVEGTSVVWRWGTKSDSQGVRYTANDDESTCYVSGHETNYGTTITIPEIYEGRTVTSIGRSAFSGCSGLTSVTIPNSVTSIGDYAFEGCSGLTSLTIPNSVTSIGDYAFSWCNGLTSLTIPSNMTTIGEWAFANCSGLTSVNIPNSVTSIGEGAFSNCSGLTSITVENSNSKYDSRNNCNAIIETATNTLHIGCKSTIIPNSVTSIGGWAFCGCTGLMSVTIPNSVTSIGESAFGGCSGLTSVTIPNSVISIGSWAFTQCYGLTSVNIPNSVTSIGEGAFFWCDGLYSVTVYAKTPISINYNCFSNCAFATLYVPAGCKAAYEAADYWKEFKEIVEITNFGDPTANTLALSDVSGYKGKQVELPIALNNQHEITGLQFDLYLPDGVTIATKSNGKLMITTTSRMEGNYSVTGNIMENGNFVRVAGYSADSDPFTGTSGDILTITLNIGEYVADGDYPIYIRDIVLSDVNNTEYHPANAEGKLTVKSYTLGDVDNSGAVNINDVVCIINYILNRTNGVFIEEAADVDASGTININDVVTLINRFILMRSNAPAQTGGLHAQQTISITDNYLNLATIDIQPGETKEVELLMTNANTVAAIQGNIRLPKGLSFVTKSNGKVDVKNIDARSEDFTLSCAIQDDGSLTFAQYSADGFTYEGNSGGIFTFKVKADENAVVGDYDVNLTGVVLSIEGVGYDIPDRTSTLKIIDASGIDDAPLMDNGQLTKDSYYTLDGRKVEDAPTKNGVYITNGHKVVIK